MGVLFAAGAGVGHDRRVRRAACCSSSTSPPTSSRSRSVGAKEVTPQEAPELHGMIDRLCVQADLPKPRVAMVQSQMPNAFALGRSPKHATVCATTAIIDLLTPAELEGVMAHELSHVANRDVAIMTLASFFASLASMIVQFAFFFGGGSGGDDDDDSPGIFAVIVVSMMVYAISFFLMQALSRYREYAADRGAAILTGRPSRAGLGADEARRRDAAHPQAGPAPAPEMNAFYIFPVGRQGLAHEPVLDAPADGQADRGARADGERAAGHRGPRDPGRGVARY